MDWLSIVVTALSSSALTGIIAGLVNRNKLRADTVQVIQDTASDLIKDVREQAEWAQREAVKAREEYKAVLGELEKVRQENADLRCWAERLVTQVTDLGGVPAAFEPTPPQKYKEPVTKQRKR